MIEQAGYVLAIILNMLPFSFFRYYPFRRDLRISVRLLVVLYGLFLLGEIYAYTSLFDMTGKTFYESDSWLYMAVVSYYLIFALIIIRADIFKQLYLWFSLALWELAVFGIGIWVESEYQASIGLPRFVLLDMVVIALLILTIPLALHYVWRIEPFLSLNRPQMWQWSWLGGAVFFALNLLYSMEEVHYLDDMAFCRTISFVAASLNLYLQMRTFELEEQRQGYQQKLKMANEMTRIQQDRLNALKTKADQVRHIYAKLEKLLNSLEQCGEQKDRCQALNLLRKNTDQLDTSERKYCRYELLDAILRTRISEAESAGIRAEVRIQLLDPLPLDDIDLCALFGNLLENAIHGCKELPPNQRWLTLYVFQRGRMQGLTVDNSYRPESVHEKDGVYYSVNDGIWETGIGIGSIHDIVTRADGDMEIIHKDGVFSVSILLKNATQPVMAVEPAVE